MRKKLQILLLIIMCSVSFAKNFGAEIFREEATLYFNGKEVNIFNLENNDLKDLTETLNEYKSFKGIDLYEQLENREYSVVFEKNGTSKKFLILIDLNGDTVEFSDSGFETEEMNGLKIKYTIGENQYIYAYDENYLVFSNDMTLFFLTFETDLNSGKFLINKEKFGKLMNEEEKTVYSYYIETENLINDKYISLAKAYYQLKNGGYIKKNYLLDGSERVYKTFDLKDYIPSVYLEVEMGKNSKLVKNSIKKKLKEFKIYDENKIDMYLNNNMELAAEVKLEIGDYTLISLGNYKDTEIFVKQMFEETLFYNKKLEIKEEKGYKYFEIPLLFRKIYFIEAGNFLLFTDNLVIVNKYLNGEIYNDNFTDVMNYDEIFISQNKIKVKSNGENILLDIEEMY